MAATFAMSSAAGTFPVGTSVAAYKASDFPTWWSGGALPAGLSSVTTATVASDGTLTFTGLVQGTAYKAYASIRGTPTYVSFTAKDDTGSSANPESVTGGLTDAQLAARLPLSVDTTAGKTLDYAVGVAAATVTVPNGAKLLEVEVIPSSSSGSVTAAVFGKGSIAPPAGYGIGRDFKSALTAGAAGAGQIVIGGSVGSYYVSWAA